MKKFLLVFFVLAIAGCSMAPVKPSSKVISKKIVREVPAKGVSK